MLVVSLIVPLFMYCDVVFSSMGSGNFRRLNVLFNNCTRFVHGLRRFDHISNYQTDVLGMTLANYLNYRYLLFLFRIL